MTGPIETNLASTAQRALSSSGDAASTPAVAGKESHNAGRFAMSPTRSDASTSVPQANAGEQIRSMLATIDSLGASRSQQRASLDLEVRRLEGLATDDPARAELANTKLLATLQNVQEVSFRVELATKVVDQVANGIRTVTQTQV